MKDSKLINVIFGVLDSGEIFVEVGGEQFTPYESFYKLASIESAKHAHKVRDLQLEVANLQDADHCELIKLRKENRQLKIIVGNIIAELEDGGAL